MRRKSMLLTAATVIAMAGTLIGPAAPAHACHDDIFISENPIHNGICWNVHETGVEERIEQFVQKLYCTITQDPACS